MPRSRLPSPVTWLLSQPQIQTETDVELRKRRGCHSDSIARILTLDGKQCKARPAREGPQSTDSSHSSKFSNSHALPRAPPQRRTPLRPPTHLRVVLQRPTSNTLVVRIRDPDAA